MKVHVTIEQLIETGLNVQMFKELFPLKPGDWFYNPENQTYEVYPTPDPSGYEFNQTYFDGSIPVPSIDKLFEFIWEKDRGVWKIVHTDDKKIYIYSHTTQYGGPDNYETEKFDELVDLFFSATMFHIKS